MINFFKIAGIVLVGLWAMGLVASFLGGILHLLLLVGVVLFVVGFIFSQRRIMPHWNAHAKGLPFRRRRLRTK